MRQIKLVAMMFMIAGLASIASGQIFSEDFESYAVGEIHGQGGWEGWDGAAGAGAPVSAAQAFNGTKSIEIVPSSDLVHTYDIAGGKWVYTAQQYIPSGKTGQTYFILLNTYGASKDWSIQTTYNLATGAIATWTGAVSTTIQFDKWVELRYVIDLDLNTVDEYYNGTLIDTRVWDDNNHGTIQAVDLYGNNAGSVFYDDIKLIPYLMSLTAADSPSPANQAADVPRDGVLTWSPGYFAGSHDLYFGTDFDSVDSATGPTVAGLDVNSFDPGRLEFGQDYFWRVDEVNATPDKTVFKGEVWSFTSEPYAVQIPAADISISVSTFNGANDANAMIDGSGLTGNTHGNEDGTAWNSLPTDLQPVLVFEFPKAQALDSILVWNNNLKLEPFVGMGAKDIVLETSLDGETWTVVEGVTSLTRAPGTEDYNTPDVIALDGLKASQVRLQILSNYGGLPVGMGLSEVQFYAIPTYARQPEPATGSGDVVPNAVVQWRAGREAGQHTVYVSSDPNAVADGSGPSASSMTARIGLSEFDLELGQTYYWRVDEVNEAESTTVWAGPVWSFATAEALVVDDFESYSNFSPNRPFQTWLDGFGYSADEFFPVAYGGNGTGSGIGHDIWSPSSPYFGGQTMEQTNTLPGSGQSMPFYYDNSGGVASETQRKFAVPQDWTVGGAKTLSIPFAGTAGNTGTLYVKINGVKVTYPRDPGNLALGGWLAFNIDLASMDVQSVTELSIGVDGAGASGMLLIDDITLHRAAGIVITPMDPGSDNLVGHWTFDESTGATAADSSGNNNDGSVVGDAQWVAGKVGGALSFDGVDDMVVVNQNSGLPIYNNGTDNAYSIAMWVKGGPQNDMRVFSEGSTTSNTPLLNLGTHNSGTPTGQFAAYIRPDTGTTLNHPLSQAEPFDDTWHHITWVDDNGTAALYVDGQLDGGNFNYTRGTMALNTTTIGGILRAAPSHWFTGLIDDVIVYNRALTDAEVLSLAGIAGPIDKPF